MFLKFFTFMILAMSANNNEIIIRNGMNEEVSVQIDDVIHVLIKYTVKYLKIEMFPHEITELIKEKWIVVDLIKILQMYFYPENLINGKEMADVVKLLMRTTVSQTEFVSRENVSSAFLVKFLRFIYLDNLSEKYNVSISSSNLEDVKYLTDELIGYIKKKDIASSLNYIRNRFKIRFKMFINKRNVLLKKDERTFWRFDEAQLLSKISDKKCDDIENNRKVLEIIQGRLNNFKSSFKMNVPIILEKKVRKVKKDDSNRHSFSDYYEIGLVFDSWNGKYSAKEITNTNHHSEINENHDYCEIETIKPQGKPEDDLKKISNAQDLKIQFSFYDEPRHIKCRCVLSDLKQSLNKPTTSCSEQNCLENINYYSFDEPKPAKRVEQLSNRSLQSCLKRSQVISKQEIPKDLDQNANVTKENVENENLYDNLPLNNDKKPSSMKNPSKIENSNKLKKSVKFKDQSTESQGPEEIVKCMKTLKINSVNKAYQHPDTSLVYLLIPERIPFENNGKKNLINEDRCDFFFNVQKEGVLNFNISDQNNFILLIFDFFETISKFSKMKIKLEITIKHPKIVVYYTLEDISKSKLVCLENNTTKLFKIYEMSRNKYENIKKLRMKFKNSKVQEDIFKFATTSTSSIKDKKEKIKRGSFRGLKGFMRIKKTIRRSISFTDNLEQPLSDESKDLIKSLNLFDMMIMQSNLKGGMGLISDCLNPENNFFRSDKQSVLLENFIQTFVLHGEKVSNHSEIKSTNETLKNELNGLRAIKKELLELNNKESNSLKKKIGDYLDFSFLISRYNKEYSHHKTLKDIKISLYLFIMKYNNLQESDFLNMSIYQINYHFNSIIEKINSEDEAKELAKLIMTVLEFNKEQYSIIKGLCMNLILKRMPRNEN